MRVGVTGAMPDAHFLNTAPNTVLDLNGLTENLGILSDISGTGQLGSGTLIIDQHNFGTVDGAIVGSGNIVKTGPAFFRFLGGTANTYTGLTTVSQGALQLDKSGGAAAISGNVLVNGGTLHWMGADQVANGSAITVNAPGSLDVGGNQDTIGSLAGTGVVAFDGFLAVGGTNASTLFAGVFKGEGIVQKEGLGTLTLTGINADNGVNAFLGRADAAGGTLLVNGYVPGAPRSRSSM